MIILVEWKQLPFLRGRTTQPDSRRNLTPFTELSPQDNAYQDIEAVASLKSCPRLARKSPSTSTFQVSKVHRKFTERTIEGPA